MIEGVFEIGFEEKRKMRKDKSLFLSRIQEGLFFLFNANRVTFSGFAWNSRVSFEYI